MLSEPGAKAAMLSLLRREGRGGRGEEGEGRGEGGRERRGEAEFHMLH